MYSATLTVASHFCSRPGFSSVDRWAWMPWCHPGEGSSIMPFPRLPSWTGWCSLLQISGLIRCWSALSGHLKAGGPSSCPSLSRCGSCHMGLRLSFAGGLAARTPAGGPSTMRAACDILQCGSRSREADNGVCGTEDLLQLELTRRGRHAFALQPM